ncbi:MAG: exodeoxyribonuclease, partial [Chthoniobacter sp.]|nr:exodeoxyribonuclease [Chthoniobacter sp.]
PDVVCLQEIKATPSQVPAALCGIEGYSCYWHGGAKGYSGVGLLVRTGEGANPVHFYHPEFDFENRIVVAVVQDVHCASVYVPNGGKDFAAKMRFLEALRSYADRLQKNKTELVLCGDLNVARAELDVHPKERRQVIGQLPEERVLFERILETGLVDLGRMLDPDNEGMFTWWAPWRNMRARNIGWRLDYILASDKLTRRVSSCSVQASIGTSDHAPVVATFRH